MLKGSLLHPQILAALARAGHGSRVLISDGNYPHWTTRGPNTEVVYLNLAPGVVSATDALRAVASAIPVEQAAVMQTLKEGPYARAEDPPIWEEFRAILREAGFDGGLTEIERFAFYAAAADPATCLVVATADQRLYANLLLTIGVVRGGAE
jgi:L-fucose mutarotase